MMKNEDLRQGDAQDLSIIIVSWNVKELLANCLNTIDQGRGELDLEVIVVDAGSVDGSPDMVRDQFAWVQLVAESENVGFPKGNNIGIERAHGRHILLLNPDTEVVGDALSQLVAYLDLNLDVGVVSGMLKNPDGSIQSSRRRFPNFKTAVFESTWFEPLAPRSVLQDYYAEDLPLDKPVDVDWLTGASLMVRHEVIDQVGLMDEGYFMYSEELDWCRRIKDAGWRIVFIPTAVIIHYIGKSSEQAIVRRHIDFNRAKLRYFRKYHGRTQAGLLRLWLLFNYSIQLALEGGKGLVGHKRDLRQQRVRAYWAVLRSGLRPAGY
jgi:N-acetylglucosaminyl-diphospho-decaprenol L-rhamnosyltransferase